MIGETIAKNLIEKYNPKSVLFCPYKEEMWDSMKTIYDYFDEETNILVEVMPIAYYTLKGNKVNGLKIEFQDLYRENFPMMLTWGESEAYGGSNKWDIIIFHYPYDNLNNVTRPMIYSSVLKEFCNHLVLVHYACRELLPTKEDLVYAGVRNSDLVIFDNEEQAREAGRFLNNQFGWHGECVGWGSAKYDMIEQAKIPTEWQQKAEGKRVVLLQSSIIPYLQNKNKLNQIESIIKSYINNPKVCLIWRPHPLYRETIIAHQRNDLWKFTELKDMVAKSPKDILDTTPTPEKSLKFADEMISDRSSLVTMWKTTGKKLTMLEG